MSQYNDGMGGRFAGTTVGGGVVSPYLLLGQVSSLPFSSLFLVQLTHLLAVSLPTRPRERHNPLLLIQHPLSSPSTTFSGVPGAGVGPSLGTSASASGGGGGMSPSRATKGREPLAGAGGFVGAAGMPIPQHGPPPSSYHNQQSSQSRRMLLESSGPHSGVFYSTNSEYSQPNPPHVGSRSARLNVANPDESARQAYIASGPLGSRVGGAGQEEEIPPTYDSLVGSTSGSKKEKSGGLRVTNDTNDGEGSGSGA
ncbi:hypothetical protein PQX77_012754 [Marasmius sp. AFHP31]|nr:hypothetical protein PQX77_012754 [Marasmius sp. AFHP31]